MVIARAQYLNDPERAPDLAALLQVASLLGICLTRLDKGTLGKSSSPVLFSVVPTLPLATHASHWLPDDKTAESARIRRIEYQTTSWFVVYSPGAVLPKKYVLDRTSGIVAVAELLQLLEICDPTYPFEELTVREVQDIFTSGIRSRALRLSHRLRHAGLTGEVAEDFQLLWGKCMDFGLVAARAADLSESAVQRMLKQIVQTCGETCLWIKSR